MRSDVPDAFDRAVLEDPLFAAEGMDIDNASGALDDLASSLSAVEREYARGSWFRKLFFVRYPLARYAVPLSFLRRFVECERLRRAYVAESSRARAQALVLGWESCARDLVGDVRRYRALHRILLRLESDEHKFVIQDMFGHLTSYLHVEKTLELFRQNADLLCMHAALRRELLAGTISHTEEHYWAVPASPPLFQKGTVSEWHKAIHDAAVTYGNWPYRYVDILETHGPLRYTLSNFDGVPTEHMFMFYVLREKNSVRTSVWVAFLDRACFFDIWRFLPKADGVTRGKYAPAVGIEKEEMPYWYETTTTLYNSRDCGYWVDIATMVDSVRRPELNAGLVALQRSSMFDMILAECARDTRSMVAHLRRRARSKTSASYSMLYDLLTRSFPGVYYLPFNRSVWRLQERPLLLGERFVPPDTSKFLSEEQAREKITPEVLAVVMSASRLREERGRKAGWLP